MGTELCTLTARFAGPQVYLPCRLDRACPAVDGCECRTAALCAPTAAAPPATNPLMLMPGPCFLIVCPVCRIAPATAKGPGSATTTLCLPRMSNAPLKEPCATTLLSIPPTFMPALRL